MGETENMVMDEKQASLVMGEACAKFFRGLGDPTRLMIVELLLDGEKNVSELVKLIGSPQGRISSHLSCLKWCGYVNSRSEGRYIYYYIADERVKTILELAHEMVYQNAESILACRVIKNRC